LAVYINIFIVLVDLSRNLWHKMVKVLTLFCIAFNSLSCCPVRGRVLWATVHLLHITRNCFLFPWCKQAL